MPDQAENKWSVRSSAPNNVVVVLLVILYTSLLLKSKVTEHYYIELCTLPGKSAYLNAIEQLRNIIKHNIKTTKFKVTT